MLKHEGSAWAIIAACKGAKEDIKAFEKKVKNQFGLVPFEDITPVPEEVDLEKVEKDKKEAEEEKEKAKRAKEAKEKEKKDKEEKEFKAKLAKEKKGKEASVKKAAEGESWGTVVEMSLDDDMDDNVPLETPVKNNGVESNGDLKRKKQPKAGPASKVRKLSGVKEVEKLKTKEAPKEELVGTSKEEIYNKVLAGSWAIEDTDFNLKDDMFHELDVIEREVLVFNLDTTQTEEFYHDYFQKFDGFESAQKFVIKQTCSDSIYLVTFSDAESAEDFVDQEFDMKHNDGVERPVMKEGMRQYTQEKWCDSMVSVLTKSTLGNNPKNFEDDPAYSVKDDSRRVLVPVGKTLSPEEENTMEQHFRETRPGIEGWHKTTVPLQDKDDTSGCLFVVTFKTPGAAAAALGIQEKDKEFVARPELIMLLSWYLQLRAGAITRETGKLDGPGGDVEKVECAKNKEEAKEDQGNTKLKKEDDVKAASPECEVIDDDDDDVEELPVNKVGNGNGHSMKGDGKKLSLDSYVVCKGFMESDCDVEEYFQENHEHVEQVWQHSASSGEQTQVYVKFKDKASASSFLTLNYVRYRGRKLVVAALTELGETDRQKVVDYLMG